MKRNTEDSTGSDGTGRLAATSSDAKASEKTGDEVRSRRSNSSRSSTSNDGTGDVSEEGSTVSGGGGQVHSIPSTEVTSATEAQAEERAETKAERVRERDRKRDKDRETGTKTATEGETERTTETAELGTDAEAETVTGADAGAETGAETGTETGAETAAGSRAGTGTDTGAVTEPDTEVEAGAEDEETVEGIEDAETRVVPGLSLDTVFELAKNERRRRVLRYLRENEGPTTLGELAEHIAALENDKAVHALNSGERKRVYVGLYQCHLPKLDDHHVIDFDRNPGITLGPNADAVLEWIDASDETPVAWERYYGGLAIAAILSFGVATAVGGAIPTSLVVGGLVIASVGLAIAQRRDATTA